MTRDLVLRKRQEYLRSIGRPTLVTGVEVERVVSRIRSFHARGMSYVQMERQTGISCRTVCDIATGPGKAMKRRNLEPLKGLRFEEPDPNAWVEPTGTRRRLGALWRAGFPLPWLDERLDMFDRRYLQSILRGAKGKTGISYRYVSQIAALYDKLEGVNPADVGIDKRAASYARTFAGKRGCVPRECWDVDTIDDPAAIPQWTGQCGTWIGARIHRREQIPMCGACAPVDRRLELPGFSPDRLRELRERHGMGRATLGELIGVHESTIMYWESGRSVPERRWKIDKLLSVLDATFEDVCEEVPDE